MTVLTDKEKLGAVLSLRDMHTQDADNCYLAITMMPEAIGVVKNQTLIMAMLALNLDPFVINMVRKDLRGAAILGLRDKKTRHAIRALIGQCRSTISEIYG